VQPEIVVNLYERSDVGVVLLKDKPIFAEALPTKLYESMAAGRPVLLSARGEAADAVELADAGVIVTPEDPHALADSIRRLHACDISQLVEMGLRGRRHVAAEASLDGSVSRWLELLESVRSGAGVSAGRVNR
jgi:glycosyltransferase involved in cell wall biosynthesis